MIDLTIDYDIIIRKEEVRKLFPRTPGVYVFLDADSNPLYVGVAIDLKERIRQHLTKQTNTKRYSHNFKKIALIFEKDALKRKVAEVYLINALDAPLNRSLRLTDNIGRQKIVPHKAFSQCSGTTNDGHRCKRNGHTNGFCHLHGGNGNSLSSLREVYKKTVDEMILGDLKKG